MTNLSGIIRVISEQKNYIAIDFINPFNLSADLFSNNFSLVSDLEC